MKTIYIRLLDEGTEVFRPTETEVMQGGLFKVLPTANYTHSGINWNQIGIYGTDAAITGAIGGGIYLWNESQSEGSQRGLRGGQSLKFDGFALRPVLSGNEAIPKNRI